MSASHVSRIALIALALLLHVLVNPASAQTQHGAQEYAELLIGSFSSERQARTDARYDVVEARVVRIWPERSDGVWLYQEQALLGGANAIDPSARSRPYFQRIVHLQDIGPGMVRTTTYPMLRPERFVGAWRAPESIGADALGGGGCAGIATRVAAGFWRGENLDCPNAYRGAVRVTSHSLRTAQSYANWDRGWNIEGEQVWGPADGGYVFDRTGDGR